MLDSSIRQRAVGKIWYTLTYCWWRKENSWSWFDNFKKIFKQPLCGLFYWAKMKKVYWRTNWALLIFNKVKKKNIYIYIYIYIEPYYFLPFFVVESVDMKNFHCPVWNLRIIIGSIIRRNAVSWQHTPWKFNSSPLKIGHPKRKVDF